MNNRVWRQLLVLLLALMLSAWLYPDLSEYFLYNIWINSTIVGVFVVGAVYCVIMSIRAASDHQWLKVVTNMLSQRSLSLAVDDRLPQRLRGLSEVLVKQGGKPEDTVHLWNAASEQIDNGMENRLAEARYAVGLLVFLGLLGTFWGLLGTISGLSQAVQSISFAPTVGLDESLANPALELKDRILVPLSSMGTAFSSSVFGLGASLVLNYLALQLRQVQSAFSAAISSAAGHAMQFAESPILSGSSDTRGSSSGSHPVGWSAYHSAQLEQSNDRLSAVHQAIEKIANSKTGDHMLITARAVLNEFSSQSELLKDHTLAVRDLITQLDHLISEQRIERQAVVGTIRDEVRTLSRTIAAMPNAMRAVGDGVVVPQNTAYSKSGDNTDGISDGITDVISKSVSSASSASSARGTYHDTEQRS